ncbi:MAG: hypothetical protein PHD36_07330 [Desulfotomaculaceae bacterium]|nr:hypothetical protein [Desulfotomaculaceae bacterium]
MDVSTGYIVSSQNNFMLIHHLLRDAAGTLWLFYLTPEGLIKCGISEDSGETWSNPSTLANEVTGPFSVALDNNNGIHLCAIRKFNQLTYLQWQEGHWSTNILPLDTRSGQPFFPIVHVNQPGIVNIVCGFRKTTNAWSMKHYLIHPREYQFARTHFDVPFASDLCLDMSNGKGYSAKYVSFLCGAVDSDAQGNLHLIQRYFDGQYFQLCYSFYNFKDNQWEQPLPLINNNGNCGIPAIAVDLNNKPHILWASAKANKFRLNYRGNSVFWQPQINRPENSEIKLSPVLIPWDEELAAFWHEGREIFYLPAGNFSDMDKVSILTCPEITRNIKLHPQAWQTNAKTVLPITFARKENGYHLLYFTTTYLPEEKSIEEGTQNSVPNPDLDTPPKAAVYTDPDTEPSNKITNFEEPGTLTIAGSELDELLANFQAEKDDDETEYESPKKISTAAVEVVTVGSKLITWKI